VWIPARLVNPTDASVGFRLRPQVRQILAERLGRRGLVGGRWQHRHQERRLIAGQGLEEGDDLGVLLGCELLTQLQAVDGCGDPRKLANPFDGVLDMVDISQQAPVSMTD
jgi:hypothetical protein